MEKMKASITIYSDQKSGYVVNPSTSDIIIVLSHSIFHGEFIWFETYREAKNYSRMLFLTLFPHGRIIIADKF